MGANTFINSRYGKTAKEAFSMAVADSQYESGHSYSGAIGMKSEFVMLGKVETDDEAHAIANKHLGDNSSPVDDKWGPAGCVEITKPQHPENGKLFLFFGWASS